jgi:hypothetical protein
LLARRFIILRQQHLLALLDKVFCASSDVFACKLLSKMDFAILLLAFNLQKRHILRIFKQQFGKHRTRKSILIAFLFFLPESLNRLSATASKYSTPTKKSLTLLSIIKKDRILGIEAPRVEGRCLHLLSDILKISVLTYLTGGTGCQDMHLFSKERGSEAVNLRNC